VGDRLLTSPHWIDRGGPVTAHAMPGQTLLEPPRILLGIMVLQDANRSAFRRNKCRANQRATERLPHAPTRTDTMARITAAKELGVWCHQTQAHCRLVRMGFPLALHPRRHRRPNSPPPRVPPLRTAADHLREGGRVNRARFSRNVVIWARIPRRVSVFLVRVANVTVFPGS